MLTGALPLCLPTYLNEHTASPGEKTGFCENPLTDPCGLDFLTEAELQTKADTYCGTLNNQILTVVQAALSGVPMGGLACLVSNNSTIGCPPPALSVNCSCTAVRSMTGGVSTVTLTDNPSCDGPVPGPMLCSTGNCGMAFNLTTGMIIPGACGCNVAMACGNSTSPFLIAPPGSPDPAPIGIIGEMLSAVNQVAISPNASTATFTVQFNDDFGFLKKDTKTVSVSGRVQLYGILRADGTADLVMDFGVHADDFTLHFSDVNFPGHNVDIAVTEISIAAGSGNNFIPFDAAGRGLIPAGALLFSIEARQNGQRVIIRKPNPDQIVVLFNSALKTFSIPALSFDLGGPSGSITMVGSVFSQPPRAAAGPAQTVKCTSPAGARVTLDGSRSSDPDGDIGALNWWEGPFLDPRGVVASGPQAAPWFRSRPHSARRPIRSPSPTARSKRPLTLQR